MTCTHLLCELIGGDCSIAVSRSRGCHAAGWTKTVAADVFDEVRALLGAIDRTVGGRVAAVRLAQIVRAEALEERNLLTHARDDEPELADALAPLLVRRDQR
jgi:hypothetical protein